jgi:hypothetical protein
MFDCRRMTRRISDGLDRRLSFWERLGLTAHLLVCPPCARFRRAAHWLHTAMASAQSDARLPHRSRERIRRALREAAGGE